VGEPLFVDVCTTMECSPLLQLFFSGVLTCLPLRFEKVKGER
jgi:hypothetical protein